MQEAGVWVVARDLLSQKVHLRLVLGPVLNLRVPHVKKLQWELDEEVVELVGGHLEGFVDFVGAGLEVFFGGEVAEQVLDLPLHSLGGVLQVHFPRS